MARVKRTTKKAMIAPKKKPSPIGGKGAKSGGGKGPYANVGKKAKAKKKKGQRRRPLYPGMY